MPDISKMTDRQLRNEVRLLRDELAIMKRKYEDIIYNLDTDNFSSRFVKEQGDMKTAIEVTAKGIEAKVSNEEFQSKLSLTAERFETSISNLDLTLSSKITQSAETIKAEVKQELEDGDFVTKTTFELTTDGLSSEVSRLDTRADNLSDSISSIRQTANTISLQVEDIDNGTFNNKTLFTQSSDKFYFDGYQTIFTGCIKLTNNAKNDRFAISHDESTGYPFISIYNYRESEPIVIGKTNDCVYLADQNVDGNKVATQGWVLDHAGSGGTVVARFG